MYCFVLTFDFLGVVRWSYRSILQRAFWQHFSQNQFWSRHFFLQLTHQHTTLWSWHSQKAKSMEKYLSPEGKPKPISRSVRSVFLSATTQCNFVTKMWPHTVVTQKWMANWHHFYNLKQKRKSALQTCLIFLVKNLLFTFETRGLKWVCTLWKRFSFPITDTVIIKHCGFWKDETILLSLKRFSPWLFRVTVVTIEKVS